MGIFKKKNSKNQQIKNEIVDITSPFTPKILIDQLTKNSEGIVTNKEFKNYEPTTINNVKFVNLGPKDRDFDKKTTVIHMTEDEKKIDCLRFLYYWLFHVVNKNDICVSLLRKIHQVNLANSNKFDIKVNITKSELMYAIAFCERWILYYRHKLNTMRISNINMHHFKMHNHFLKQFIHLHYELTHWLSLATKNSKPPQVIEKPLPIEENISFKKNVDAVPEANAEATNISDIKDISNLDSKTELEMEGTFDKLEDEFNKFDVNKDQVGNIDKDVLKLLSGMGIDINQLQQQEEPKLEQPQEEPKQDAQKDGEQEADINLDDEKAKLQDYFKNLTLKPKEEEISEPDKVEEEQPASEEEGGEDFFPEIKQEIPEQPKEKNNEVTTNNHETNNSSVTKIIKTIHHHYHDKGNENVAPPPPPPSQPQPIPYPVYIQPQSIIYEPPPPQPIPNYQPENNEYVVKHIHEIKHNNLNINNHIVRTNIHKQHVNKKKHQSIPSQQPQQPQQIDLGPFYDPLTNVHVTFADKDGIYEDEEFEIKNELITDDSVILEKVTKKIKK